MKKSSGFIRNMARRTRYAVRLTPAQWVNTLQGRLTPRSERVFYSPRNLLLEVSRDCNFSCEFCIRQDFSLFQGGEGNMSLEFYRSILDAFPRAISVGLAGLGEPTLHPSLVEMVAMAKSRRMRTSLITNGTRLHEIGAGLVEAGLDRLCISLKSLHRDDFAALTKTPAGVFDRVRENVQLIVTIAGENGSPMDIRVAWVVSRSRLKEIPAAIEMVRQLGVKHLDLQNLIPSPSGAFTLDEVLVKEDDEAVRHLQDLRAAHEGKREVEVSWPILVSRNAAAAGRSCRWYWNTLRVDALGRMNACGRFYPPRESFVPPFDAKVFNSPHFVEWRGFFLDTSRELPPGCRFCVENHGG